MMVILCSTGAVRAVLHCTQQPGRPWREPGGHGLPRTGSPCPPPVPSTAASLVAAYFFSPSKRRNDSKAGGAFIPPPQRCSTPFPLSPERRFLPHFRPHFRLRRPLPGGRTAHTCPTKTRDALRGGSAPLLPRSRHSPPPPAPPSQPAPSRLQLQRGGGGGGQLAVAALQVLQRLEEPLEHEGQRGSWGWGGGSETPREPGADPKHSASGGDEALGGPSLCPPLHLYLHRSPEGRREPPPPPSAASTFPCGERGRLAVGQRARGGPSPLPGSHLRGSCRPWRCWKRRCASTSGCNGSLQSCRVMLCRVCPHPGPVGRRG